MREEGGHEFLGMNTMRLHDRSSRALLSSYTEQDNNLRDKESKRVLRPEVDLGRSASRREKLKEGKENDNRLEQRSPSTISFHFNFIAEKKRSKG